MQEFQLRVIEEKEQLDQKLRAISAFINEKIFAGLDPTEQSRMKSQRYYMQSYSDVLGQRIEEFKWQETKQ